MRAPKFLKFFLTFIVLAALVASGVVAGWKIADQRSYELRHHYPLLDPSVSNPDFHSEIVNFDPLRQDLKEYLTKINGSHSLYFEYLPNGINIRDGDDNTSQAASLIKTPVVMDLYKLAEQSKLNLDSVSTVEPVEINDDPLYGNPTNLKSGETITLRQAAKITLRYSDNTTLNIIKDRILPLLDSTSDSFRSLDLSYAVSGLAHQETLSISARSYSSILKCLYYSCFNSPSDSSEIIGYLTGSVESNRLTAGVPRDVKIAHKVGSSSTNTQSDCGIIYYPGRPYLVCLMFFDIPGNPDKSIIDGHFKKISSMIYSYVADGGKN